MSSSSSLPRQRRKFGSSRSFNDEKSMPTELANSPRPVAHAEVNQNSVEMVDVDVVAEEDGLYGETWNSENTTNGSGSAQSSPTHRGGSSFHRTRPPTQPPPSRNRIADDFPLKLKEEVDEEDEDIPKEENSVSSDKAPWSLCNQPSKPMTIEDGKYERPRLLSPELQDPEEISRYTEAVDQLMDVRCPICIEPFTNPVTLSCHHSICRNHIEDMREFERCAKGHESGAGVNGTKGAIDGPFAVTCPKCREQTRFQSADTVQVNREMSALVATMLRLLKFQAVGMVGGSPAKAARHLGKTSKPNRQLSRPDDDPPEDEDDPPESSPPPKARPCMKRKPSPESSQGKEVAPREQRKEAIRNGQPRRRIMFVEPSVSPAPHEHSLMAPEGGTTNPRGRQKGGATATSKPLSPTPTTDGISAPVNESDAGTRLRLQQLERELEEQRQVLAEERDRQNKIRLAEYRRKQRAEQLAREYGIVWDEPLDTPPSRPESAETTSPHKPPKVLATTATVKAPSLPSDVPALVKEKQVVEAEDDYVESLEEERRFLAERKVRLEAREKLREEKEAKLRSKISDWIQSAPKAEKDTNDITSHLTALQDYITKLQSSPAPSPVKSSGLGSSKRSSLPLTSQDLEVETRLLQVEREVRREVEEELSNAQKAAIAEERARAMIAAYQAQHSQKNKKVLPKPSFTPKLNKLTKLPFLQ